MATLAPSRAARSAIASPMPRLAPEMNSVLPLSDVIGRPPIYLTAHGSRRRLAKLTAALPARGANFRERLFAGRCRAAAPWVGGPQQSSVGHCDRIGRGPAQRFDHAMSFGSQRRQRVVGKAVLDPHLVRQPRSEEHTSEL